MSYSIIIPIYNEKRVLSQLIEKLQILDKSFQIIIVDDGSDDGSIETLKKYAKKFNIIQNKSNLGKGASIIRGIEYVRNRNTILIDGDLEIEINCIPELINVYEKNNFKTLIGNRWNKESNKDFGLNRFGNYIINFSFNLLFSSNIKDVLCCVRIIKTDLIKSLNLKSKGFSIEIETLAKLVLNKNRIIQSKVDYHRRTTQQGKKLKMSDGWKIILVMLHNKFFKVKL